MGFDKDFKPVLRFLVVSDVHYKDGPCAEKERMEKAIRTAYELSEKEEYPRLDAIYAAGDYSRNGSPEQTRAFKRTLDENVREGTEVTVSLATHEFNYDGEEAALKRFSEIFKAEPDSHKTINGYHFISLSCGKGCRFDEKKKARAAEELKKAAADDPRRPIFFFQHPHISDTVYGSINWGEDDLYPLLMNYPQTIDFSGHSHAPINDPRSIHQKHFTCLGTGTLSYFELDEFDKIYGTVPPRSEIAAQGLFVEADAENRVRIYPYDFITSNFFPYTWKIDEAWNPESYLYTDARYKTDVAPYFRPGAKVRISDVRADGFTAEFDAAEIDEDYVDDYNVLVKRSDGVIVRNSTIWSEYYFYDAPKKFRASFDGLFPNEEYQVEIYANGFWKNRSAQPLKSEGIRL